MVALVLSVATLMSNCKRLVDNFLLSWLFLSNLGWIMEVYMGCLRGICGGTL